MELMDGGQLFDRIIKRGVYSEADARDVCVLLLDAIRTIHKAGIVHRDLKPENLLLSKGSDEISVKICNFGCAARLDHSNGKKQLTKKCGSPEYVAPEILRGDAYGTSVDMWSFGVILYVLLVGYEPFHEDDDQVSCCCYSCACYYCCHCLLLLLTLLLLLLLLL